MLRTMANAWGSWLFVRTNICNIVRIATSKLGRAGIDYIMGKDLYLNVIVFSVSLLIIYHQGKK